MKTKRPFRIPDYRIDPRGPGDAGQWRAAFQHRMGIDAAREAVGDDSPWGILGVAKDAAWEAVRAAYRKLVKLHHPDRGGDPAQFRKVQAAYEVLEFQYGRA